MDKWTIFTFALIFIASYLIGAIPWGYLIGKMHGMDIRKMGSGNIGATNVTRTIGRWNGRLCFLLDFLKGFTPVLVISILIKNAVITDEFQLSQIIAGAGAVLGHMFPVYLRFRGGKGVSTSAGAICGLAPYAFLIAGTVWVLVFLVGRYVSLASIAAAAVLPVAATFISLMKYYPHSYYVLGFLYLLALITIIKHSGNIKRLLNGTENRFDKKSESARNEDAAAEDQKEGK